MGLGSRSAGRHETVGASKAAGVDPSAFWEHQPGDKVMTADGFPGVVAAVNDGPLAGTETYQVHLDGGLGGGEYTGSQLRALTASAQASTVRTAADDYPELGTILEDRPDIAPDQHLGSKTAAWPGDYGDYDGYDYKQCPDSNCGEMVDLRHETVREHVEREHPDGYEPYTSHVGGYEHKGPFDVAVPEGLEPNDGAEPGVDEHGHLTWGGSSPGCRDTDEYSMFGQNDAVEKQAALECPYETAHLKSECGYPHPERRGQRLECPYPKPHTPDQCGYPHEEQRREAKQARFYTEDEVRALGQAEEQRLGMSAEEILKAQASSGYCVGCGTDEPEHAQTGESHFDWATRKHNEGTHDAWGKPLHQAYDGHGAWGCNNFECAEHPQSMYDTEGLQGMPGYMKHDLDPDADLRRQVNQAMPRQDTEDANWLLSQQHQGPSKFSSFDPWAIVSTAAADPDFRFHVTAAWADVRDKAKRLRAEGRVHVTAYSDGMIHGEVKGDHHVYETGLQRLPGKAAVSSWSCGCKWGAYHWGAADDLSRFAGRMCSHALALQFEAQSRGMFGREIVADDIKPAWVPRRVVVKYDIDADKNVSAPATRVASLGTATPAGSLIRRTADLEMVALAFTAAGIDLAQVLQAESAVNNAWGEPVAPRPNYLPGPTAPKDPNANPASAGWASTGDPEGWVNEGPSGDGGLTRALSSAQGFDEALFEPEMGKEALLPLLIPIAEAIGGAAAGAGAAEIGAGLASGVARGVGTEVVKKVLTPGQHQQAQPDQPSGPAGPSGPSDGDEKNPLNYGARADLHDGPEPALPSTDGDSLFDVHPSDPTDAEPESLGFATTGSVEDVVAQFQATAGARALNSGSGPAPTGPAARESGSAGGGDFNFAAAAKAFLETGVMPEDPAKGGLQATALKNFTPAEQAAIINEGENVRHANIDRLDLAGTHYEHLEATLASQDSDEEFLY